MWKIRYVNIVKKCKHYKQEINRDVNGSQNILLKYVSSFISNKC